MTLYMLFAAFRERHHLAMVTVVFFVSAIVLAAASAEDPHYTPAGEKLFRELGCVGCHYPDGKGIGPSLNGLFGSPLTEPGGGALTVDEEYVREAILNPSAAVAAAVAPVMPTFAGRVTEEQLRALIAYVKSLSPPVEREHQLESR